MDGVWLAEIMSTWNFLNKRIVRANGKQPANARRVPPGCSGPQLLMDE